LDIEEPIDLELVVIDPIYRRSVIDMLNRKDGLEVRARKRHVDSARSMASIRSPRDMFALVQSKA